MDWASVRSLEDLAQLDPRLASELTGVSLHFHLPPCNHTRWEVERMPYAPQNLRLRPNRPVSRAWDLILRMGFGECVAQEFDARFHGVRFEISPQSDPPQLEIVVPYHDREQTRRLVRALNVVTAAANAVAADALSRCRREHDEFTRDLGLNRPPFGLAR